jgi:hypothetical protein
MAVTTQAIVILKPKYCSVKSLYRRLSDNSIKNQYETNITGPADYKNESVIIEFKFGSSSFLG